MRKAKVDENLIAELEAGGEALSGQINEGRATPREREVRAAMRAADRLGRDVVVPTVVLPSCTAVLGTASSLTRACLRSLACGPVIAPHRMRTKLTQIMSGSWSGARSCGCSSWMASYIEARHTGFAGNVLGELGMQGSLSPRPATG